MPIRIPDYEPIERRLIPPKTAVVPQVGAEFAARAKYETTMAGIQRQQFGLQLKQSQLQYEAARRQAGLTVVTTVANFASQFANFLAAQRADVRAAERSAELSSHAMEASKSMDDFRVALAADTAPEKFTQQVMGLQEGELGFTPSMYEAYYAYKFDEKFNQVIDEHTKQITDPLVKAKFTEWMNSYGAKAYGDYLVAGMDRDANLSVEKTQRALQLAVDSGSPSSVEAIIDAAVKAKIWTFEGGENLKAQLVAKVNGDNALKRAREFGAAGPQFLIGEEAREMYDLTEQQAFALAEKLADEQVLAKKYKELKDWPQRDASITKAEGLINSGDIRTVEDLRDLKHELFLYPEDYDNLENVLRARADAVEKDREAYSDDMLETVHDAIKAGDADTADRYLNELLQGGYGRDKYGRLDPEVRRAMEALKRIAGGEELNEWNQRTIDLWLKVNDKTIGREDLETFLKEGENLEGGTAENTRQEYRMLLNELQEIEREAKADQAKAVSDTEERMLLEYQDYFDTIFYAERVKRDELVKLKQWMRGNYPMNSRDKSKPGIPQAKKTSWERMIDTKIEQMDSEAYQQKKEMIGMGEDRIQAYFKGRIDPLRGVTNKRSVQKLFKAMDERDSILLQYWQLAEEAEDPIQAAVQLLNGMVNADIERAMGPDYAGTPSAVPGGVGVPELPATEGINLYDMYIGAFDYAQQNKSAALQNADAITRRYGHFQKRSDGKIWTKSNDETGETIAFDTLKRQWVHVEWEDIAEFNDAWEILNGRR